jgi:hypothetical protein
MTRSAFARLHSALAVAVLLSAIGVGAHASELVVRNLQVDLEFLPTDFDYEIKDGTGTRTGSDALDTGFGIALGGRYSFARTGDAHGFLVGAQVLVAQSSFNSQGELTDYGLRVEGGYGFALNDQWTTNLLLRVGYGWATFALEDNAVFPAVSLSGGGLTYGAALGIDYAINDRWQINTAVGYLMTNYDLSGGGVDMTIERSGLSASIGFLYRFSNLPRPLE